MTNLPAEFVDVQRAVVQAESVIFSRVFFTIFLSAVAVACIIFLYKLWKGWRDE
jgi:hypothetical protein